MMEPTCADCGGVEDDPQHGRASTQHKFWTEDEEDGPDEIDYPPAPYKMDARDEHDPTL